MKDSTRLWPADAKQKKKMWMLFAKHRLPLGGRNEGSLRWTYLKRGRFSRTQNGISDVWTNLTMVVVLGVLLYFFRIPYQYEQPPLEANVIADLSDRIVFVEERADGGDTLEILLDHPPTYMANIVADLGRTAVTITRGLQQHFPNLRVKKVRFVVQRQSRGVERLILQDRMVSIEFDRELLVQQKLTESYPYQTLLNLSSGLILGKPEDEVVLRAFCADKVAVTAAVFCGTRAN